MESASSRTFVICQVAKRTVSSFSSIVCGETDCAARTITVFSSTLVSTLSTPVDSTNHPSETIMLVIGTFALSDDAQAKGLKLPSIFPRILLTAPAHPSLKMRRERNMKGTFIREEKDVYVSILPRWTKEMSELEADTATMRLE
jgi:hypothetical protein